MGKYFKAKEWRKGAMIFSLLIVSFFNQRCALQPAERQPLHVGEDQKISRTEQQGLAEELCVFDDPGLRKWQEQALAGGNLDLAAARARFKQAAAVAGQSASAFWPRADLELSGSRFKEGSAATATAPSSGGTGVSPPGFIASDTLYSGSLAASYEIDLWGQLRNEHRAAILEVDAADADLATAEITVGAELADAWYDLASARRNIGVLEEQRRTSAELLELINFRFGQGLAAGLDITQQQQELESLRGEKAQVLAAAGTARHRLQALTGLEDETGFGAAGPFPQLSSVPAEGVPVNILAGRPDLTAAWLRLRAIDHRTAAAVGDWLPELALRVNIFDQAAEISRLFDELFWQLTASLAETVFDGGRRSAVIEGSEARAEEQLYRYANLYRRAIRELRDALLLEKQRLNELASLEEQYRLAGVALDLARQRYRSGEVGYLRVLTALQAKHGLESRLVSLQRRRLGDRIGLCRAMGIFPNQAAAPLRSLPENQ